MTPQLSVVTESPPPSCSKIASVSTKKESSSTEATKDENEEHEQVSVKCGNNWLQSDLGLPHLSEYFIHCVKKSLRCFEYLFVYSILMVLDRNQIAVLRDLRCRDGSL